jgi:2-phosphoglycerate kinase
MDSPEEIHHSESPNGSHVNRYVPPWKEPYVIAMAGSSGSGKTSVAQRIIKELNVSLYYNWILRVFPRSLLTNGYRTGALDYSSFHGQLLQTFDQRAKETRFRKVGFSPFIFVICFNIADKNLF